MDETAYYFLKIIEADQEQIIQGGRSCFDDTEDEEGAEEDAGR